MREAEARRAKLPEEKFDFPEIWQKLLETGYLDAREYSAMNSVRPLVCIALTFTFIGLSSIANAIPLQLGVYAPRLPFPDNRSRVTWAKRVGQALSDESGLSIEVRAFTKSSDLMAFMEANRIHLVLADPTFLVEFVERFELLASGSGPEGHAPAYAVFVAPNTRIEGISTLRKSRLALVETGRLEISVLSNFAFEGLVNVATWFERVDWVNDLNEATNRVLTKRADVALGYQSVGRAAGLHMAVKLRGLPLPVLAQVKGAVEPEATEALHSALRGVGLKLPAAGPMNRLTAMNRTTLPTLEAAISRPPGKAQPRRPVWSPMPLRSLERAYPVERRGQSQLGPALRRWRRPQFPPTRPKPTHDTQ